MKGDKKMAITIIHPTGLMVEVGPESEIDEMIKKGDCPEEIHGIGLPPYDFSFVFKTTKKERKRSKE